MPDMKTAKAAQPMLSGVSEAAVLPKRKTSKIAAQGVERPPYPFRRRIATVVHFEPANIWRKASHWAIDEKIPGREIPRLPAYARNTRWGAHLRTGARFRASQNVSLMIQ